MPVCPAALGAPLRAGKASVADVAPASAILPPVQQGMQEGLLMSECLDARQLHHSFVCDCLEMPTLKKRKHVHCICGSLKPNTPVLSNPDSDFYWWELILT